MKRSHIAFLLAAAVALMSTAGRADETQVKQVLDKAIKALGGEEKLSKAEAFTWKSKGKITLGGNQNDITTQATGRDSITSSRPSRASSTATRSRAWRSSTVTRAGGNSMIKAWKWMRMQ